MSLEIELEQFKGIENYYKTTMFTPNIKMTDGVKYLCEKAESYWLIDIICSYQNKPKLKAEEFQVWKLVVNKDKGIVTCDDGNENILITQKIPYTDFPLHEIGLYLCNDVIMLKSEY